MKERYTPWYYYENWMDQPLIHISLPLPEGYGPGMITSEFTDTEEFRIWLRYTYTVLDEQLGGDK